ncbi:MAG: segregation ATPase, FtsK/SpoIIIE family [Clostridia bacterium]|jgi:S-DNA-T family DNA segregation ATPase FtsK/SpoIIIE|nr:segregation ATPase, FtsK/SpoIIIE family [Clostridia bacterium]
MKTERLQRYNSSKYSRYKNAGKKSNTKAVRNIFIILAVFAVISLYFSGFSTGKFLMIFFLEVVGMIGLIAVFLYITIHSKKKERCSTKRLTLSKGTRDIEQKVHINRPKIKSRKLIKLDKRNFNWSDEDIQRNAKEDMKTAYYQPIVEERKFIPYRSPFEPINPPAKPKEEQVDSEVGEIQNVEENKAAGSENSENPTRVPELEVQEITVDESLEDNGDINDNNSGLIEYEATEDENITGDETEEDSFEPFEQDSTEDSKCTILKVEIPKQVKTDNKPFHKMKPKIRAITVRKKAGPENEDVYPPVELLNANHTKIDRDFMRGKIESNAKKLVETLASFGVGVKVINISQGPSVTRYELQPNAGVKVSKIVNLSDDIALSLAAKGVRIEAPIPGKAAIGIEVPNEEVVPVFLREVIESKEFRNHPSKLAFAVGKDIAGNNMVADIARMPHLLIAGATGSGKSVCINTLIASILYKAKPSEVRLIMVDPKVVELGIYNGIPHLLIPVVTDPKKAAGALNWAVQEMTNRYKLFADNNVRDLKGYNALLKEKGEEDIIPQIVIIIDELADLMMVAPNEVEDSICRLAQMARAAGMHLVIATQRPSVDVITGLIKANIPSRISFAVSSQVDSRTILDMAGAEKLLGKGDMLFNPMGEPKPIRVQGAFVSDKEVEAIVSHIKSNVAANYDEDILETINSQTESSKSDSENEDELLPQAIEMSIEHGQASASLLQRKFKIGYSRAARILDQMEARGIVSGYEGSKPRQVLITKAEWDEMNI